MDVTGLQDSSLTTPPAAPTALSAVSASPSTITLSWTDNSNDENGFRIERSSDGVNFTEIAAVGASQTSSYDDSGLSAQATYYYRVRATNLYNTLSFSSYTNIASATTTSLTPQSPVNLYHFDEGTGTAASDSVGGNNGTLIGAPLPAWITSGRVGSATLSFSGNGQYSQTGESTVQATSDLAPVLGATSSLLFWVKTTQTGNDTHWRAPAVTGVEQSGLGNDINWGYLDASGHIGLAVGDSGSVLSANPVNDGQWHHIALSRDAVSGAVRVYIDGALSNSGTLQTGNKTSQFKLIGANSVVNSDGVTFVGANFFNGQLDDVQIYNVVIDPAFVTALAQPPAAPANLAVTPVSGTELDLSWTDNAYNETGYEVWRSINSGAYTRIAQLPANTASYMNAGLTQGTAYSYFVRAVDSAGSSDSNIVNAATPIPPAAPTGVTITYLSPTEVDLLWTDNATNETGYKVLRRINSASFAIVGSLVPNSTSFQDTTVQPGISYDYRIQAYNTVDSNFAAISITTPAQSQYQTYLAGFGLTDPALTAPTADPDSDGIPNLLEYAFNLNPTQSNASGLPVTAMQNGYLTISFVQRTPPTDINYSVQVSDDLLNWNSGAAYTTPISITPIDASTQSVIMRDNVPIDTASKRFIRVNVTR